MPNKPQPKKSMQQLWEDHFPIRLLMTALIIGFGNFILFMRQETFNWGLHLTLSVVGGGGLAFFFEKMRNKKVHSKKITAIELKDDAGRYPQWAEKVLLWVFISLLVLVALAILFQGI